MKITKIDLHVKIDSLSRLDHLRENIIGVKRPNWYTESYDNSIVIAGYLVDESTESDLQNFIDNIIRKDFDEEIKFLIFAENRYSFELKKNNKNYVIRCLRTENKIWRIWKEFHNIEIQDCEKTIMNSFKLMEKEFILGSFTT